MIRTSLSCLLLFLTQAYCAPVIITIGSSSSGSDRIDRPDDQANTRKPPPSAVSTVPKVGIAEAMHPMLTKETTHTDIISKHGETVEIACEVNSAPAATISWKFNGEWIIRDPPIDHAGRIDSSKSSGVSSEAVANSRLLTHQVASVKSILSIPCIGKRNIGRYTCVAENEAGSTSANISVHFEHPGESENSAACADSKSTDSLRQLEPSAYTWTAMRLERVGALVELRCRHDSVTGANNTTANKASWLQQDSQTTDTSSDASTIWLPIAPSDSSFSILENGNLAIKPSVDCTLSCNFACEIDNKRLDSFVFSTILDQNDN